MVRSLHSISGSPLMLARLLRPFFLVFLLSAAAVASAQALTPAEQARVDSAAQQALASTGVPSASVAVVRGGRIVYSKAYGQQGPGFPAPRADAVYPIASISKQFTAAALLILRDEGRLSLDDHVSRYLPGISGGDRITIRQLLSHTSGLQDFWPQDYSFAAMERPVSPQQIVDRWAKKPLDFEPGTQWQYSNTGYVVAGMIAEKVAGEPLIPFLERHVFRPLGMHPVDQDLAYGAGYPLPYHRAALGPVRPARPAARGWLYAAGELAMSASDLARWDIARMNRTLLPPRDWQEQETPVILSTGKSSGYGLGVSIGEIAGHKAISHGGEAVGFLSTNIVFPDDKEAVVVLVNADFGDAQGQIARSIVSMLHPQPAAAAADDEQATAFARRLYDQLRSGRLDRSLLTENANYYFTEETLRDYRDSLSPLGDPQGFDPAGPPRLRGGFVNRNYILTFPGRKLSIVSYYEPGPNGKVEQFLVMPAG
jgi:CubicO group peptidase (beta-lactamase class C family)